MPTLFHETEDELPAGAPTHCEQCGHELFWLCFYIEQGQGVWWWQCRLCGAQQPITT